MLNFKEIQVEFEGRNPTDGDSDGISQLLKQLFLKSHVEVNGLTNIIISQHGIGSCLKQTYDDENMENEDDDGDDDDDDDNVVFGITSVINLTSRKSEPAVQTLEALLLSKCKECKSDALKDIEELFQNKEKNIGFIINERYVNIPPQVSVPLLENLQKEIKHAVEKKKDFKSDYYFMILKLHRNAAKEDEFYVNSEEELFEKHAIFKYEYSVASESDTGLTGKWKEEDEQLEPVRRVVVIEAKKMNEIIQSITGFLTGAA